MDEHADVSDDGRWVVTPRPVLLKQPGEWQGMVFPGNLDINNRPSVRNPAGGTSSVYSMSINVDGREYLIPRVSEDGRLLSEEEAIAEFNKTGNNLGAFDSPENATRYATGLHEQQASLSGSSAISDDGRGAVMPGLGDPEGVRSRLRDAAANSDGGLIAALIRSLTMQGYWDEDDEETLAARERWKQRANPFDKTVRDSWRQPRRSPINLSP